MSTTAETAGPPTVLEYAGLRLAKFGAVTGVLAILLTRESTAPMTVALLHDWLLWHTCLLR